MIICAGFIVNQRRLVSACGVGTFVDAESMVAGCQKTCQIDQLHHVALVRSNVD